MKRLRLIVEGHHDGQALANVVSAILTTNHLEALGALFLDGSAVRARGLPAMSGRHAGNWLAKLTIAANERPAAGILAVFDGDEDQFERRAFCPVEAARALSARAAAAGAGVKFSLAVVIVLRKYESLLLPVAAQLPGHDGTPPPEAPEGGPEAKDWLRKHVAAGYKPAAHQLLLTQSVRDWSPTRDSMRCFRRLESAVGELVAAALSGAPCLTPATPPPPEAAP